MSSGRPVLVAVCLVMMLSAGLFPASHARGCTGIRLVARDGSIIRARTLEFASDLHSDLVIIPRGQRFAGVQGSKLGLKWTGKYGFAGANALGLPVVIDGVNEKGLSAGILYFPGCARYKAVTDAEEGRVLAPWDVVTYTLSTCATVGEAAEALRKAVVGDVALKEWGIVPPVHFIFADAAGGSLVVEYTVDGFKCHENPLGVLTNSPAFDWHMTNLRNYGGLSADNASPLKIGDLTLTGFGQGSGMRGLPGDFTPPSRFVRAVAFSGTALPAPKAEDGVEQAFHILNQFDIPKGSVREKHEGREISEYTQWTSAADCTNKRFYIRTFQNSRIRMIDLGRCNLDAKEIVTIKLVSPESIEDLTPPKMK
jgi:choloylglycine hydrolase